jgi:hypothetical protein
MNESPENLSRLKLYFGDTFLGTIVEEYRDFPAVFCLVSLVSLDTSIPIQRHLNEYIAYSIEQDRLMNLDEIIWQAFCNKEEVRFMDLIESDDW